MYWWRRKTLWVLAVVILSPYAMYVRVLCRSIFVLQTLWYKKSKQQHLSGQYNLLKLEL